MSESLLVQRSDGVCSIVVNRPNVKNALNRDLVQHLIAAFNDASTDSKCRAILLSGAGQEAFCAGADLKELTSLKTLSERISFFSGIAQLIEAMYRCNKPIVAKVHGMALAGGLSMVAAADIVLVSDQATFGLPEVKVGLIPMVVFAALEQVMQPRMLSYMALSGEPLSAQEALQGGLVSKIYSKENLDAAAAKIVQTITSSSPLIMTTACEELRRNSFSKISSTLPEMIKRIAIASLSDDSQEGVRAFLEKRRPAWKGR